MFANVGLQTLRLVVLARLLPATAFGLMAIMMVIIGFVQIFGGLGIGEAIVQKSEPTKEELSTLYWTNVGVGILLFSLLFLSTPLVAVIYHSPEIRRLLPTVALVFLIGPWGGQFNVLLQKALKFRAMALIDICGSFINAATAIALALLGFGVWSLVWGQIAEVSSRTILLVMMGLKAGNRPMFHFRHQDLKGYLGFGLHRVGAMSLNYFNSRVDQLLIGALLGPKLLGYYSMSFNLVIQPVTLISPVLTRVAYPVFSQIKSDIPQVRQGYIRILRILLSINAPILVGAAVVAPVAVPLILGENWLPAAPVIQILAFYALLRTIGNAGGGFILARGRADLTFYWNLALFFFIPATVFTASLTGGLVYIALALLGLQFVLVFANYRFLIFKVLGPCFKEYVRSIVHPIGMTLAMGLVVYFLRLGIAGSFAPWPCLLALIMTGVSLYVLLFWLFNREDFREITEVMTKFR